MSDFISATVSFGVIISIKDKDKYKDLEKKIGDLIMYETEWMGEPKGDNSCIVSMHPKDFQLTGKTGSSPVEFEQTSLFPEEKAVTEEIEAIQGVEQDFVMLVKAVRKGDDLKLMKKPSQIAEALKEKEGYVLILQTKSKGMKFASIETVVGQLVGYMDGDLKLVTVGGVHE